MCFLPPCFLLLFLTSSCILATISLRLCSFNYVLPLQRPQSLPLYWLVPVSITDMLQRVLFKTSTFLYPTHLSSFLPIFLLLFTAKHPQTSSTLPSCSFSLEIISLWLLLSSFFLLQCLLLLLLLRRFSRVRLCLTPIDDSPPGFPIPWILQAKTLEWVAFSFSNA